MELKIAIAKIDKHGSGRSGDTVEVTERPNGGLSIILADGQKNQKDLKTVSNLVAHRVIDNIVEGMRDSAAIRTASDSIFEDFDGEIQANLSVLSVDLLTNTIIISQNNPVPVFLVNDDQVDCLVSESEPVGKEAGIRPIIVEVEIRPEVSVIAFSDGVYYSGRDNPQKPDICTIIGTLFEEQAPTAQEVADFILNRAIRLDGGRPKDDMSVVVLMINANPTDQIRRMSASMSLSEN